MPSSVRRKGNRTQLDSPPKVGGLASLEPAAPNETQVREPPSAGGLYKLELLPEH